MKGLQTAVCPGLPPGVRHLSYKCLLAIHCPRGAFFSSFSPYTESILPTHLILTCIKLKMPLSISNTETPTIAELEPPPSQTMITSYQTYAGTGIGSVKADDERRTIPARYYSGTALDGVLLPSDRGSQVTLPPLPDKTINACFGLVRQDGKQTFQPRRLAEEANANPSPLNSAWSGRLVTKGEVTLFAAGFDGPLPPKEPPTKPDWLVISSRYPTLPPGSVR